MGRGGFGGGAQEGGTQGDTRGDIHDGRADVGAGVEVVGHGRGGYSKRNGSLSRNPRGQLFFEESEGRAVPEDIEGVWFLDLF